MKKGCFELGGSDPFIVCDDANIDVAAAKAVQGRLHTNGQACNNSKRFIISDKIYDEFKAALITKIKEFVKIGDPMDSQTTIGPLASDKQLETLNDQVQKSIEKGAKIAYGELNYKIQNDELKNGFFFHPMVLEDIPEDAPAYSEELFGPVFGLYRFTDDQHAVNIANSTQYGLSGAVFS